MTKPQRHLAMAFIAVTVLAAQATYSGAGIRSLSDKTYHAHEATKVYAGIAMSEHYTHDELISSAIGDADLPGHVAVQYSTENHGIADDYSVLPVSSIEHYIALIDTYHYHGGLYYQHGGGLGIHDVPIG